MEITSTETESPAPAPAPVSVWTRRVVIGVACLPLAVISVVQAMGNSEDFGVLGKWYVMVPLAVAGYHAFALIEKAVKRVVPTSSVEECPER